MIASHRINMESYVDDADNATRHGLRAIRLADAMHEYSMRRRRWERG
ncbi:hypothetical protein C7S15_8397 [Burkholderia cepacia]|nr:hypothetical protein [Burkholderia cepacia]